VSEGANNKGSYDTTYQDVACSEVAVNNAVLVQMQHAACNARDELELHGQRGLEVRVLHELVDTAAFAVLQHEHGVRSVNAHSEQSEYIGMGTQFTAAKISM
jgi:hypothetical protein